MDHLPKARELGKKTLEEVKETAQRLGEQLRAFGFNTDFAPVLDINTNPNNPVIGSRAFSNDAEKVSEYGIIFYQGLKSSGVVTSGKHFPGHGDTANDSHHESVYYTGDETRFNTVESLPFRRASGEGIPMIMVGHITAPALDDSGLPATVSSNLIQRLRKDIKFEGVIITDSFRMKAITNLYSPEQAGVKAIEAGVDIILMPEDFITSYQGILKAVEEGVISEHRINQSLIRIKQIKKQYLDWE